jgi:hypothetical protein
VCQLAQNIKCSLYIKKTACFAFIKLIELFKKHDLHLIETLKQFVKIFHINNIKGKNKYNFFQSYAKNNTILLK